MHRPGVPGPASIVLGLVLGLAAWGCSSVALQGGDCGEVYDGGCERQMGLIAERWPGQVRRIDLQCALAACDRRQGAGSALVTFGDGATKLVQWSYAGDPAEPPAPVCVALEPLLCRTVYAEMLKGVPPDPPLAAVTITCPLVCAWSGGETDVLLTYADGSTHEQGYGWEGGLPLPSGMSSLP